MSTNTQRQARYRERCTAARLKRITVSVYVNEDDAEEAREMMKLAGSEYEAKPPAAQTPVDTDQSATPTPQPKDHTMKEAKPRTSYQVTVRLDSGASDFDRIGLFDEARDLIVAVKAANPDNAAGAATEWIASRLNTTTSVIAHHCRTVRVELA